MAKRCPNCGYGPIGPFTDNCPICAEPVRNVRSGGGGGFRPGGWPPVVKWVVVGVIAGVLGIGGCCGVSLWRMGNAFQDVQKEVERQQAEREAARRARTVSVAAADLIREFENDPAAADQKYADKYLEVTGVVERGGRGRHDARFVILHAGDEGAKIKIECFFDSAGRADEARIERLSKGQTVTIRGEYDGRVSNVQLRDCELVPEPAGAVTP
jgi:hypothetical protein